jgi:predicted transcriptional regulator
MATTSKSHKSRSSQSESPAGGVSPLPSSGDNALALAVKGAGLSPVSAFDAAEKAAAVEDAVAEFQQPKELPAHKQSWYRPADSKARKLVDKIVVHRAAGRQDAEIAKLLKTTEQSIRQYVYIAKKNGWLDSEGEPVDLEAELAHNIDAKIVRNISASLDGKMTNWQTHEMTIKAAGGRGIFKDHSKTEGQVLMAPVAIQIIMPPLAEGQQRMEIPADMLGGTPAFTDGEVVNVESGYNGRPALEAATKALPGVSE